MDYIRNVRAGESYCFVKDIDLEKCKRLISIDDRAFTTDFYITDLTKQQTDAYLLMVHKNLDTNGSSHYIECIEDDYINFGSKDNSRVPCVSYRIGLTENLNIDFYEYENDVLRIFHRIGQERFVGFCNSSLNQELKNKLNAK